MDSSLKIQILPIYCLPWCQWRLEWHFLIHITIPVVWQSQTHYSLPNEFASLGDDSLRSTDATNIPYVLAVSAATQPIRALSSGCLSVQLRSEAVSLTWGHQTNSYSWVVKWSGCASFEQFHPVDAYCGRGLQMLNNKNNTETDEQHNVSMLLEWCHQNVRKIWQSNMSLNRGVNTVRWVCLCAIWWDTVHTARICHTPMSHWNTVAG